MFDPFKPNPAFNRDRKFPIDVNGTSLIRKLTVSKFLLNNRKKQKYAPKTKNMLSNAYKTEICS